MLAVFATVADATATVSAIIAAGIVPAALEMMDRIIVAAVEAAYHFGFPTDAGAVLIIEIDGPAAGLDATRGAHRGALPRARREPRRAAPPTRPSARRSGRAASARSAPSAVSRRATARRTASCRARGCPRSSRASRRSARSHGLRIGNVFHAGDGNIHPILLYDERDADEAARALAAGREILAACVALGGSVTGEHGIGVEKIARARRSRSAPTTWRLMQRVRAVFDPDGARQPGQDLSRRRASASSSARRGGRPRCETGATPLPTADAARDASTARLGTARHRRSGRAPRARRRRASCRRSSSGPATPTSSPRSLPTVAAAGGDVGAARAGAHRVLGHPPRRYDVALVTERLTRVRDYTPADMTVTVEAGTTSPTSRRAGARGAVVAARAAAARRRRPSAACSPPISPGRSPPSQGRVRDFVIGIAVVTAAGVAGARRRPGREERRRLRSHEALHRLARDARGVTEATFKVRPLPEAERVLVFAAADVRDRDGVRRGGSRGCDRRRSR